jgi:serine/threonine protein kinase
VLAKRYRIISLLGRGGLGEVAPSAGSEQAQHYISMEYVDGKDLASLLRRIERLPQST